MIESLNKTANAPLKTRTATKHSPPLRARADHIDCRIQEIVDKNEKEAIARDILNGLPEWFGMSDSTEEYIKDSQDKPFIACFIGDEAVGFVVLHTSSKDCAETWIYLFTGKNGSAGALSGIRYYQSFLYIHGIQRAGMLFSIVR